MPNDYAPERSTLTPDFKSTCESPMPRYRSHKEVWALKIRDVLLTEWGKGLVFEDRTFTTKAFTNAELEGKPTPQAGWYYMVYGDGYVSFSPAQAFEEGYTRI